MAYTLQTHVEFTFNYQMIPHTYIFMRGLPLTTYAPRGRGGGGSSLLYISIAYHMQKVGEGVQKPCTNAYVINGRPLMVSNNE